MTPLLKSNAFSLILHATILSALCMIPASLSDRFSSSGKPNVITMQLGAPSVSAQTVSITMPTPLGLDSEFDSMPPPERVDPLSRLLIDHRLDRTEQTDLPMLTEVMSVDFPVRGEQPKLKRRDQDREKPNVNVDIVPARQRVVTMNQNRPPTDLAKQLEQIVGLEEKTSADFSKNLPPSYPPIAVRQHLEGVVTLRLSVTAEGNVERVEVLESSGHSVLDQAAMTAISKWTGKPATSLGRAVASTEVLPIRFRL